MFSLKRKVVAKLLLCLFFIHTSQIRSLSAVPKFICVKSGTNTPVDLTIGLFLTKLMDQLQQAIDNARNAGLALEIEAGRQAAIAINQAKNAYAESINLTMDRIDQTTRMSLDQLKTIVDDVVSNTTGSLDVFSTRLQQFANTLPFSNKQPQLISNTPKFVVPAETINQFIIQFDGNFLSAGSNQFRPYLRIGNKEYQPAENSTQKLKFLIKTSDLFPNDVDDDKFSLTTGTLYIPWKKKKNIFHSTRVIDEYNLLLGALPKNPGKIKIGYNNIESVDETDHHYGGWHYQTSADDGGNNDHKDVPYYELPDDGWSVKRGTAGFEFGDAHGDWSYGFISDGGNKVQYNVTTIHHGIGSSGRVRFRIHFDQTRTINKPIPHLDPLELSWGDSKVIDVPSGKFKVIFDAFDGSHHEFASTELQNKFLNIRSNGNSFTISVADPKTFNWP